MTGTENTSIENPSIKNPSAENPGADNPGAAEGVSIHRDDAHQRYVIEVDGEPAGLIDFRVAGDGLIALPHTEVDKAFRGRGLAEQLVAFALADARERGLKVVSDPLCPFIASYLDKHPDDADLRA